MRALVAAAFLLLAGCTSAPDTEGKVRSWSFTDTAGTTHSGEFSTGKPVLLFFMATWCSKCQATAPQLAQAHKDYGERTHFFTVSWDPTEDARDLNEWKSKYGQTWPHGVGTEMRQTFEVSTQSTLVFLDRHGAETERFTYASPSADQIRAALVDAGA